MHEEQYSLNFDKYFRFRAVAELINHLDTKGLTVLDVGGGSGAFLNFLKDHKAVSVDKSQGVDGIKLPYADCSFDVVTSIDTLEHIIKKDRPKFISEMIRVSRLKAILAFPHDEATVATHFVKKAAKKSSTIQWWTKEHIENGLPSQKEVETILEELPVTFTKYKNLDLDLWTIMTIVEWYLPRKLKPMFNKEFNRVIYGIPVDDSCYRYIYEISKINILQTN